MSNVRAKTSNQRVNTRLETFLAAELGQHNVEFYGFESCIEDNKKNKLLSKYAFRILIVCSDRVFITDNPPKNLDNFITFHDILEITSV
jgi:hypothetical protein